MEKNQLQKKFILSQKDTNISLNNQIDIIKNTYKSIINKTTDIGLQNSIDSQLTKQINLLNALEKKLVKFEKQKHQNSMNQISILKDSLFPDNILQERHDNFIPFYLKYGSDFIKTLKGMLNPNDPSFLVLIENK